MDVRCVAMHLCIEFRQLLSSLHTDQFDFYTKKKVKARSCTFFINQVNLMYYTTECKPSYRLHLQSDCSRYDEQRTRQLEFSLDIHFSPCNQFLNNTENKNYKQTSSFLLTRNGHICIFGL